MQAQRVHDADPRRPGPSLELPQLLHRAGPELRRHLAARHRRAHLQGLLGQSHREVQIHPLHLQPPQLEQRLRSLRSCRNLGETLQHRATVEEVK